ncbi:hypothetical protein GC105_11940 [Alkalibaculum sp. M08DMB]|uniref:PucR C-terminal helix-turn-helix domain-containing protein n=1 Tax=Alkalibaculum sporogenes TaxID=2655001 RepID=A0A6A7KAV8_9FIRM|nr:helix-turn-helix domain-containing protein [Alkalibaculum sporogenes]MPW26502.1 hypothetical protein [Alkalibaculum sporogenes]
MKLSMWMIANCLEDYSTEINIKENALATLKSVRLVPIDHCVHLMQKDQDVVCTGEGDTIILYKMSVENAFEILAEIFDFYDEWDDKMREYAEKFDFDTIIEECWHIINNPIAFIGNNKKVIAKTKQYGINDVNDEWRYISLHGHVSIESLKKAVFETQNMYTCQTYRFDSDSDLDFMTCPVVYDNIVYARFIVVQRDRRINLGDEQILKHLSKIIAHIMMRLESNEKGLQGQDTLFKILKNYSVSSDEIEMFLKYHYWNKNDPLRVCVLTLKPEDTMEKSLLLIQQDINKLLPECPSLIFQNRVMIVVNEAITPIFNKIHSLDLENKMIASISLPFINLKYLKMYWLQALYAIEYGKIYNKKSNLYEFYDYAIDYIIDSGVAEEKVCACHPDIMDMHINKSDSIKTIATYLNNNCSLLNTSKELFIHRNTLVYRINKIIDGMRCDIEDSYTRDYMSLSIRILALYDQKIKQTTLDINAVL